ncbi:dcp1 decapping family protein [Fusarium langsethiae]|uniref:Dcp1 decapping family protein n=2 Tax=Fusarium sambucinum species complex TaxID=569360 RepID=A0A0N0DDP5_FUSLA|nr:dcp1 decapping family protein [Fusarium langsethiae]GKU04451.1 unnamed protein product [Fusarium langsethiae]GKU19843.1 unnamed protein product [Fusarium langsethiae]
MRNRPWPVNNTTQPTYYSAFNFIFHTTTNVDHATLGHLFGQVLRTKQIDALLPARFSGLASTVLRLLNCTQPQNTTTTIMSRQTPRKPRHSRQPSNRIPAVSDYESDAAAIHTDYAPPPPRTNTELNLSVLQRYLPSIHTILSIAANAVIYTFNSTSESWEKSGVEGTMFVCAQSPSSEDPAQQPRACVFVLNRRGLDNVIVDLSRVSHAEVSGELVIMKVEGDWEEGDQVLGVWIHNDKDETREMNAAIIQEAWKIARSAGPVETTQGPEAGPAMQAMGRRLSLSDLFGTANGFNVGH